MGYHNDSNRNLTNAYMDTVNEQKMLKCKLLREEMGASTEKMLAKVNNKLASLFSKLDTYEDEISGNNYLQHKDAQNKQV